MILLFVTALCWAKARDPFRRIHFSLRTSAGKTGAIAVLPRHPGSFPIVIFAHGSGEDVMKDGNDLRLMAEQGLAAVSFNYDKTNQANFDLQMTKLLAFLQKQSWARTNAMAWVGNSLGANRTLSFLIRHPEAQPQVLVRIAGGWVEELGDKSRALSTLNSQSSPPLRCKVWLVHGERDRIFPADDCRKLAALLEAAGMSVRLDVLPGRGHQFEADRNVVFRHAAEYCASQLGAVQVAGVNIRPLLWHYWLLAALAGLFGVVTHFRPAIMRSWQSSSQALRMAAGAACVLAAVETAAHLALPQLCASPGTVKLARSWLVLPELRDDFDWLAQSPLAQRQKLGVLLQHLELAELQRRLFQPQPDETIYRDYVLSPWIGNDTESIGWRRPLWEAFYPRIRRETDPVQAAEITVRFLRERVSVRDSKEASRDILQSWAEGDADAAGFERLYTAALRSAGVPARIGDPGQTELLSGGTWRPAPRPLLE